MNGSTEILSSRLKALNSAFREQTDGLAETSDKTNRHVKEALDSLAKQTSVFSEAAQEAKSNADEATAAFTKNSQDLLRALEGSVSKTLEAGETFDDQATRLMKASAAAAEQARSLREEDLTMRRDLFLKTARFIVEDLNSLSIDLTRLLDAKVPDADWKRYTAGDRSIFTRNLLKGKQAAIVGRITEKLKADDEMRQYVTRFVDEFDRLVRESEAVDPENLLHSTFMTADVGRLYLLLNRSLGRDGLQE